LPGRVFEADLAGRTTGRVLVADLPGRVLEADLPGRVFEADFAGRTTGRVLVAAFIATIKLKNKQTKYV
jgi:hypothetical protein